MAVNSAPRRRSAVKPQNWGAHTPRRGPAARALPPPLLIVLLQVPVHLGRRVHVAKEALVEAFGRVDAAVAEEVVHRDDLRDDGDILPWVEVDGNLRQLDGEDAEDRRHVDEAYAPDLHVVALQLVTPTDEDVGAATLHDDDVVGDQTV